MTAEQKQCLLACLGFYPVKEIDGQWGSKSREATERLQEQGGIVADGVFGNGTLALALDMIARGETAKGAEPEKEVTGTFWPRIRYWTREEFMCRCWEYHEPYCDGFPVEPDQTLVELVDDIRHIAGAPGHRSSGIRCRQHNADSGGVANSKHMEGKALDFWIEGMSGEQLLALVLADPRTKFAYIIIPGEPYVHVEVR